MARSRLLLPSSTAASSGRGSAYPNVVDYPRLANVNAFTTASDPTSYSRYGLVLAQNPVNMTLAALSNLKSANQDTRVVFYFITQSVVLAKYSSVTKYYDQMSIYPGWWLNGARTTITDATVAVGATTIGVADISRFTRAYLGGAYSNTSLPVDLLVYKTGYGTWEHVRMTAPPANGTAAGPGTLTISTRGYNSTAQSTFVSGDFIAGHLSPFPGSWTLNVTASCPIDASGLVWNDAATQRIQWLFYQLPWDGIFLDSSAADISGAYPNADANNDGTPDGGNVTTSGWYYGERDFALRCRALLGTNAIIMTNGGIYIPVANGAELEHSPYYRQGATMESELRYIDYQNEKQYQGYTIENGDLNNSDQQATPPVYDFTATGAFSGGGLAVPVTTNVLQQGRLTHAVACLKRIFGAFDYGGNQHGDHWLIDELIKGLGYTLAATVPNGTQTYYDLICPAGSLPSVNDVLRCGHNDTAVAPQGANALEEEQALVTAVAVGGGINGSTRVTVTRAYNSSPNRVHRAGMKVLTQSLLVAGLGWLGQPAGSPVSVAAAMVSVPLVNPDFETTTATNVQPAGWATYGLTGLGAAPATSYGTTAYDTQTFAKVGSGTQSLKMTVTTLPPAYYSTGIQQAAAAQVTTGEYYIVKAKMRASKERQIQVALQQSVGGSAAISRTFDINTTWPNGVYSVRIGPTTWTDAAVTSALKFHVGQALGDVEVDSVALSRGDENCWYQDFTNGRVYVNVTVAAVTFTVPTGVFKFLTGTQNPSLNSGAIISTANANTSVTLQPNDALFLQKV